ncbi:MAG TPA: YbaB/EbfC family DNA-binding protein [Pseudonocardiaceae bacterium]
MTNPNLFSMGGMSIEEIVSNADELLAAEQRRLHELDKKVDETTTTVHSKDRSFAMTFDGRGEFTSLAFNGEKYRKVAPVQLASMIVETFHVGRIESLEKLSEMVGTPVLPGLDLKGLATGKVSPAEIFDSMLSPAMEAMTGGVIGRDAGAEGGPVSHG